MKEEILKKIQKLLALSKSDNQHEAELALSKANQLMKEHQLSHQDLIPQPDITSEDTEEITGQHYNWARTLANASAKLFDCKIITKNYKHSICFIGDKTNVACAQAMFWHLFKAWKTICNNDYTRIQPPNRKQFRKSHGLGYASRIYERAVQLTASRHADINKATGKDLVVVADAKLEEFIKKAFPKTKSNRSITVTSGNGYLLGQVAGDKVNLNNPIERKDHLAITHKK